MKNLYQKGIINSAYNCFGSITIAVLQILFLIIVVRMLTVEDYGLYSLLISIKTSLVLLGSFGISPIIYRYVPEYFESKNYFILKKIIKNSLLIRFSIGVLFATLVLYFGPSISQAMNAPILVNFLPILTFIIIISFCLEVVEHTLISLLEQKYRNIIKLIFFVFYLVFTYILLKMGYGIYGVLSAFLVYNIFLFLVCFFKVYSRIFSKQSRGLKEKLLKRFTKYGIFVYFSNMSNILLDVYTDNFLISFFLGTYFVGLYSFTHTVAMNLFAFSPAILVLPIVFPIVIRKYTTYKSKEKLKYFFKLYNRIIAFFAIPILFGACVLSDKIIVYVFDPKYLPVLNIFNIYIFFFMIWTFVWPSDVILRILEKSKFILLARVFVIYNLIADIILIPIFGIFGAMIATGTSLLFITIFNFFAARRFVEISYPWKSFIKIIFNSLVMVLPLVIFRDLITNIYSLILFAVMGTVIYFSISRINKIFRQDKKIFEGTVKSNPLRYL